MIDIHCHILPGVDDGPSDLETSLKLCDMAYREGIRKIIATPHYISGECSCNTVKSKTAILNSELGRRGVELEILSGNEAYVDYGLSDKLKDGECLALNDSRYVLLELPMLEVPSYTGKVIFEIKLLGYTPIIAHPERNRAICERPEIVSDMVKDGCLMQLNSTSLLGASGKNAQRIAKLFVKHNLAHFIATDAHSGGLRRPVMKGVRHILNGLCGKGYSELIMVKNPDSVLKNQKIEILEPIPFKKTHRLWPVFQPFSK